MAKLLDKAKKTGGKKVVHKPAPIYASRDVFLRLRGRGCMAVRDGGESFEGKCHFLKKGGRFAFSLTSDELATARNVKQFNALVDSKLESSVV